MQDKKKFAKWEVGGNPKFGSYFQENPHTKLPIEWIVVARDGNKALLLSKYGIDAKQYHTADVSVTWEISLLRKWLNNEFFNQAFDYEEKQKILTTLVSTPDSSQYNTKGGNSTNDKLYLLSLEEAEKYLRNDEVRKCIPTAYAISNGSNQTEFIGTNRWWLRSPGLLQTATAVVNDRGELYESGYMAYDSAVCVRPAMWIDLNVE